MKNYLKTYQQEIDLKLEKQATFSQEELQEHLTKIQFFQHERLIHLLVTLFFGLFALLSFLFGLVHPLLLVLPCLLIILLIFYVFHYFFLENTVQYLYKQYDAMHARARRR